jgi:hypothetical protein
MTGFPAHYSLIQYCPDRFRAEAVNVGLMVFAANPRIVKTQMATGLRRLKKVFGLSEQDVLRAAKSLRGIESRLKTSEFESFEEWTGFIETRANSIQLTPPRLVKIENIEVEFSRLFRELVGEEREAVQAMSARPQQILLLEQAFSRLVETGRAFASQQIEVPLLHRQLEVPYAYQNGVLNLVKPQQFKSVERATKDALQLAVEGDLLHRHSDTGADRRLIVVSAGGEGRKAKKAEDAIAPLFAEYNVRLVRNAQVPTFIEEVESQAH